jgi:predicted RNase H-like nuclease
VVVLGVDGCPYGWVGILLDDGGFVDAVVAPGIAELVALATLRLPTSARGGLDGGGHFMAIGIDIPIGLSDDAERDADRLVATALGRNRSSLFMTPPRAVLELAGDPVAASALCRQLIGKGVSRQSLGLARKVLEVDAWQLGWRESGGAPVIEIHPELTFHRLADRIDQPRPATSKKTWAGHVARRDLLRSVAIELPDDLGAAGLRSGSDDVLDAAAVAWTAREYAAGRARAYPDADEQPTALARIWC